MMGEHNQKFSKFAISSVFFVLLLSLSSLCDAKTFGLRSETEVESGSDMSNGINVKPSPDFVTKSDDDFLEDSSAENEMAEKTNEIWHGHPALYQRSISQFSPHMGLRTGDYLPIYAQHKQQQQQPLLIQRQPMIPANTNMMHKRYSDGIVGIESLLPSLSRQQIQEQLQHHQQRQQQQEESQDGEPVTNYIASSTGRNPPTYKLRPLSYNFRGFSGRNAGYMPAISQRKRQILFRQCFFNPISCF